MTVRCKKCKKVLHFWDYLGANEGRTKFYYRCPKCGVISIVEKKIEET